MAQKLLANWEDRIHSQVKVWEQQCSDLTRGGEELSAATDKVNRIRVEQADLRKQYVVKERVITSLWEQQETLAQLLDGLEESLPPRRVGTPQEAAKHRARDLQVQLAELEHQCKSLARETAEFHTTKYSDPLEHVGHVLDAHDHELNAVQSRIDQAERQLRRSFRGAGM